VLDAAQAVDWGLYDTMIDALGNEYISANHHVNSPVACRPTFTYATAALWRQFEA
jgi:hypothetical protein